MMTASKLLFPLAEEGMRPRCYGYNGPICFRSKATIVGCAAVSRRGFALFSPAATSCIYGIAADAKVSDIGVRASTNLWQADDYLVYGLSY